MAKLPAVNDLAIDICIMHYHERPRAEICPRQDDHAQPVREDQCGDSADEARGVPGTRWLCWCSERCHRRRPAASSRDRAEEHLVEAHITFVAARIFELLLSRRESSTYM